MLNKLKTNINDLQFVNLIEDNWKLIDRSNFKNEIKKPNDKWYIGTIPYNEIYKIYKVKNNAEKNDNRGILLNFKNYQQFLNDYGDDLNFSGIWEMDTISCGNFYLLVLVNRKSKIVFYDIIFTKKSKYSIDGFNEND